MIIQNNNDANDFGTATRRENGMVEVQPLLVTNRKPLLLPESKFRVFVSLIERKGYFTLLDLD